ncbi:MAG: putative ABC transporter permease [Patescibacteria group bacterium]
MFIYFVIFLLCAFFGWILEVFYRSYRKKFVLVNPGFLKGPYLPIYGFGGIILFLLSDFLSQQNIFFVFLTYFVVLTALELVTGLIFENYFKTKLWDYSKNKFNYKGIVCLEFSVYWSILALFFQNFFYPLFLKISILEFNGLVYSILGFIYGIIFVDMFESFKLAYKIRTFAREFTKNIKEKTLNNKIQFQEMLKEFEKNSKIKLSKKYFLKDLLSRLDIFFRIDARELKNNFDDFIAKYKNINKND